MNFVSIGYAHRARAPLGNQLAKTHSQAGISSVLPSRLLGSPKTAWRSSLVTLKTCFFLGFSTRFWRSRLRAHKQQSVDLRENESMPVRINDKWYDVQKWTEQHPGGAWIFEFVRGRDVTALFHAIHWHKGSRAASILQHLPQLDEARAMDEGAEPFTFAQEGAAPPLLPTSEKSEFVKELHEFLSQEFPTLESTKASPFQWTLITLALMCTAICWWGWFNGDLLLTALLPLVQWMLTSLTFHDACHSALSTIPEVNYLFQFTAHPLYENAFIWYTQHLVSHHQYTNDDNYDSDIHIMGTTRLAEATSKSDDPRPLFGTYGYTQFLIKGFLCTIGSCILGPVWALLDRPHPPYGYCIQPAPPSVSKLELGLSILPSVLVLIWPLVAFFADPMRALFLSAWPFLGSSVIWFVLAFTSHVQEECQPPAEGKSKLAETCWWARQAETSLDYSVGDAFWGHAVSGLNAQSLHHLVPNVCHCHFPRIYSRYAEICSKHGVRLNQRQNLLTAIDGLLSFAKRVNPEGPFSKEIGTVVE